MTDTQPSSEFREFLRGHRIVADQESANASNMSQPGAASGDGSLAVPNPHAIVFPQDAAQTLLRYVYTNHELAQASQQAMTTSILGAISDLNKKCDHIITRLQRIENSLEPVDADADVQPGAANLVNEADGSQEDVDETEPSVTGPQAASGSSGDDLRQPPDSPGDAQEGGSSKKSFPLPSPKRKREDTPIDPAPKRRRVWANDEDAARIRQQTRKAEAARQAPITGNAQAIIGEIGKRQTRHTTKGQQKKA